MLQMGAGALLFLLMHITLKSLLSTQQRTKKRPTQGFPQTNKVYK